MRPSFGPNLPQSGTHSYQKAIFKHALANPDKGILRPGGHILRRSWYTDYFRDSLSESIPGGQLQFSIFRNPALDFIAIVLYNKSKGDFLEWFRGNLKVTVTEPQE